MDSSLKNSDKFILMTLFGITEDERSYFCCANFKNFLCLTGYITIILYQLLKIKNFFKINKEKEK